MDISATHILLKKLGHLETLTREMKEFFTKNFFLPQYPLVHLLNYHGTPQLPWHVVAKGGY